VAVVVDVATAAEAVAVVVGVVAGRDVGGAARGLGQAGRRVDAGVAVVAVAGGRRLVAVAAGVRVEPQGRAVGVAVQVEVARDRVVPVAVLVDAVVRGLRSARVDRRVVVVAVGAVGVAVVVVVVVLAAVLAAGRAGSGRVEWGSGGAGRVISARPTSDKE